MASKEGFDSEVAFNFDSGIATGGSHERISSTPLSAGNTSKKKDLSVWEQALRSEQQRLERENAELQQAWTSFHLAESDTRGDSENERLSTSIKRREKSPAREHLSLQQIDTPAKGERTMAVSGKSCVGMEMTSDTKKVIGSDDVEQSPSSDTSMRGKCIQFSCIRQVGRIARIIKQD